MRTRTNKSPRIPSTPLNKALKFLSYRQRSIQEIRDYLTKKEYSSVVIEETVEKLLELKFLNDEEFTKSFINSRQTKGKSKRVIDFELKLKGIERELSEKSLAQAQEDIDTAKEYIEKRINQFDRLDPEERKKKIVNRLKMRGYNWDVISNILKRY